MNQTCSKQSRSNSGAAIASVEIGRAERLFSKQNPPYAGYSYNGI